MRHSTATLAVIAVLVAAVSLPVLARGNGRPGHGVSGARAHHHSGHARSHRHFAGPRIGFFVGAPLFAAPLFDPSPIFYSSPPTPPVYTQQNPGETFWYFCPEANGYYPHVQECPGGWQQVPPQPPPPAPSVPG